MTNSNIPENINNQQNTSNSNMDLIDLIDSKPISDMRPIYEGFSLDSSDTED